MENTSRILLLKTVRKSIETYLNKDLKLTLDDKSSFPDEILKPGYGIFVSLWRFPGPDIRASKGIIYSEKSLIETAINVGIGTLKHDAIFPFVKKSELLNRLHIEISIISTPVEVLGIKDLQLGDKALIVSYEKHTGIFLPELIKLAHWDCTEAVSQLCLKSGLPGNMWRDSNVKIFTAEVDSFIESEPDSWNIIPLRDLLNV